MKATKHKSTGTRIVLSCLVVAVVLGVSYLVYYLINYTFNKKYEKYLLGTSYEAGTAYKAMADSSRPDGLPDGFKLAEKNDQLRLYYNEETTEIAVYSEKTGKLTFSNPQNLQEDDYDNPTYFYLMKSILVVSYYQKVGDSMSKLMNTYQYAVSPDYDESETEEPVKQFSVEKITNGIRVIYNIGNLGSQSITPDYVSTETYNDLLEKFTAYDEANKTRLASSFKNVYRPDKSKDGFYSLNSGVKKRQRLTLEENLKLIGWTIDDYTREMNDANAEFDVPVSFDIPLQYTLEGDKLIVKIVTDHISENGGASIEYIDVLPYFGAEYYKVTGEDLCCYYLNSYEEETGFDYVDFKKDGSGCKVVICNDIAMSDADFVNFSLYEASLNSNDDASEETAQEGNETESGDETESAEETDNTGEPSGSPEASTVASVRNNDGSVKNEPDDAVSSDDETETKDETDTESQDITGTSENAETTGAANDEYIIADDAESIAKWNSNSEDSGELSLEIGKVYMVHMEYSYHGQSFVEDIPFVIKQEEKNNSGYYFVPNGSGSLIKMNSVNCDSNSDYSEYIYGLDVVLFDEELRLSESEKNKLPVYGWTSELGDIFVILSRGESLGELHVMTANDKTCLQSDSLLNYNTAYTRYYLRTVNKVSMSSADEFTVWNEKLFDTELTQEYCFLPKDSGYSGMANYYRNYLVEKGKLVKSEATEENNIGIYLDIIGAIKGDTTILGFTTESVIPLTTFKQAESIVDSFIQNDVKNVVVNLQGWMNDGYYHNTPDDINVIRKLGGKSGLESLAKHISNSGGKLYADMMINEASFAAKDFHYNNESSRIYGAGYVAAYGKSSPTTYSNAASLGYRANLYNVVSPKYFEKYVDGALSDMKKIAVSGISFRDLGTELYSDMKKTCVINREHAKEITLAMFDKTVNSNKSIMLNSALGYTFEYADDIINAPIGDNNYTSVDIEVPFYEMVIHGYINYSGYPINLSADTTKVNNILELIEYGASPHFTFTYCEATKMKYTALNNMYATNYVNWVDEACDIYDEVNAALSSVTQASIVEHKILDDAGKVKKITYDNGVVIYVNHSDSNFDSTEINLAAKSYYVKG